MESMLDDRYILKDINSQSEYIVESSEYIWFVRKGIALLYLTQVNGENVPQRRYFLGNFNPGDAFLAKTVDIEGETMKYLVSAEADTEILGIKIPEFIEKRNNNLQEYMRILKGMANFFIKLNNMYHLDIQLPERKEITEGEINDLNKDFANALAYSVKRLKESERIEITERKALFSKSRISSLKGISQFLSGKIKTSLFDGVGTENPVYDTCHIICKSMGIGIVNYTNIKEYLNGNVDLEGISRVSKFPLREITLEGEWWKKDGGNIFAFHSEDKRPIALIQTDPGKYTAFDTVKKVFYKVNKEYASKLLTKAYMIYKPFPNKALGKKEILGFIFSTLNKRDFIFLGVFTLVGTIIGLIIPLFEQLLFDNYVPEGDGIGLVKIGLLFVSLIIGSFFIDICEDFTNYRLGIKIKYYIESAVYDRLFNLPSIFFNGYNSSELAKRVINITGMLEQFSGIIIKAVVSGMFSLIYFIQMISYNFKLAAVGAILIALNIGVKLINRKLLIYNSQNYNSTSNMVFDFTNQVLTNIKRIRISRVTDIFLKKWCDVFVTFRKVNLSRMVISNYVNNILLFLTVFNTITFYFLITQTSIDVQFGKFIAFTTLFGMFSASVLGLADAYISYITMLPAFNQISPILKALPEDQDDNEPPSGLTGNIEISNVSFKYSNDGPFVLKDINLSIKQGEYVGIVGASGSGKSTLLRLLLGFEKPVGGKIFYDSMDICKTDKRELRKRLGVVLQDGKLVSGSIYENITLSNQRITAEQVKQTVKMVGFDGDIERMPMGLHTVISENSSTISGGQKQRILIARAIVNNPKILFLDEATSALDNMTQAIVTQNLDKLNITKVVIAHRLSTIINCHRIIVMDKGMIVESGTYDELMKKNGVFCSMASRQIA